MLKGEKWKYEHRWSNKDSAPKITTEFSPLLYQHFNTIGYIDNIRLLFSSCQSIHQVAVTSIWTFKASICGCHSSSRPQMKKISSIMGKTWDSPKCKRRRNLPIIHPISRWSTISSSAPHITQLWFSDQPFLRRLSRINKQSFFIFCREQMHWCRVLSNPPSTLKHLLEKKNDSNTQLIRPKNLILAP